MARQRKRRFSLREQRERKRLEHMRPMDALIQLVAVSWTVHHPDAELPEPGQDPQLDHRMKTEAEHLTQLTEHLDIDLSNKRDVTVSGAHLTELYMELYELHGRTVPVGGFAELVLTLIQDKLKA